MEKKKRKETNEALRAKMRARSNTKPIIASLLCDNQKDYETKDTSRTLINYFDTGRNVLNGKGEKKFDSW